jgi:hypothetical protein
VKIWLFLKCVQFLKSCVQFPMNTILNPAIAQFPMKKKGDTRSIHVSHIGGKERRANETCISHISKGRRALSRCVSLLLNMEKEYLLLILYGILLASTCGMPVGTHTLHVSWIQNSNVVFLCCQCTHQGGD